MDTRAIPEPLVAQRLVHFLPARVGTWWKMLEPLKIKLRIRRIDYLSIHSFNGETVLVFEGGKSSMRIRPHRYSPHSCVVTNRAVIRIPPKFSSELFHVHPLKQLELTNVTRKNLFLFTRRLLNVTIHHIPQWSGRSATLRQVLARLKKATTFHLQVLSFPDRNNWAEQMVAYAERNNIMIESLHCDFKQAHYATGLDCVKNLQQNIPVMLTQKRIKDWHVHVCWNLNDTRGAEIAALLNDVPKLRRWSGGSAKFSWGIN